MVTRVISPNARPSAGHPNHNGDIVRETKRHCNVTGSGGERSKEWHWNDPGNVPRRPTKRFIESVPNGGGNGNTEHGRVQHTAKKANEINESASRDGDITGNVTGVASNVPPTLQANERVVTRAAAPRKPRER